MLIIGLFEQSIELEQALAELENSSIAREHIRVVFMDSDKKKSKDLVHNPHGFEVGISFATGGAVVGVCRGFVLTWGPIIWGLIGAFIGFLLGLSIYLFVKGVKRQSQPSTVTVMIQCTKDQTDHVRDVLWKYQALSVGQVDPRS